MKLDRIETVDVGHLQNPRVAYLVDAERAKSLHADLEAIERRLAVRRGVAAVEIQRAA